MLRSEFIQTIEGMRIEHLKRFMKVKYLEYTDEPKSKKGINKKEKLNFRANTKSQLKKINGRSYQSKLILEINFYVSKKNPPAIQQLVKNYLDLLHKDDVGIDNLKSLLFKDDSDIYILMTRIHYVKNDSGIKIRTYNFNNFIQDFKIAKKYLFDYQDYDNKAVSANEIDSLLETLETHNSLKDLYIEKNNMEFFEFETLFIKQRIQEAYLKSHSLTTLGYINLLHAYSKEKDYRISAINKILSHNIFLSSNIVEISRYPTHKGDSLSIQNELKEKLLKFKKKHYLLFPLLCPIKVIIIAREPEDIARKVDLDNIARTHVLPLLIDIFEPPSDRIIPDYIKNDSKYNTFYHNIKGIPKNGIVAYEIIKIPDQKNNNGRIEIVVDDGYSYDTIWDRINGIVHSTLDV